VAELLGLSDAEVTAKRLGGLDNSYKISSSKSTSRIVRDNTLTLFNAVNASIALALIAVGSYLNAAFIGFIIYNAVVGIIVELRARNIVDKLMLLNKEPISVVRNGEEVQVASEEIVLGDLLKLSTGDQVPSDATIKRGVVEANEALLTGESDLITKREGAHLLSGSFITSGSCFAEVEHVGKDNYSTKLVIEAKVDKPVTSELLSSMRTVSKFTARFVVPMGFVLLAESLLIKQVGTQEAVVSTASAVLGMLPKGMMVLIVISLILAVIKLGRKKVLVQEMYSIETMAHTDVLCLDKTGTITEGKMKVRGFETFGDYNERQVMKLMGSFSLYDKEESATMQAVRSYFGTNKTFTSGGQVPFSSDRKWSSVRLDGVGDLVLGAPDKLLETVPEEVLLAQSKGVRVLLLGVTDQNLTLVSKPKGVRPIAMIELEDPIRKDAKKTFEYLRSQGVDLKIISGDNPATVSAIARRAGFKNYEDYVNAAELSNKELKAATMRTAIFGRVSPQQKRMIIRYLKKAGKTVAMTGDGVNDLLALREADLSIAMAEGDAASKQIANLVLIDSDFADLPDVLFEARRVVNNMFRIGTIFFIKTIYSLLLVVLSALSIVTGEIFVFPFIAIQITVIDQITEGWPGFWMSLENDRRPIRGKFLRSSLLHALPNALLITASVIFLHIFGAAKGWSQRDIVTVMFYLLGSVTIINVIRACLPLNRYRIFIVLSTILAFMVGPVLVSSIIQINPLNSEMFRVLMAMLGICVVSRVLWGVLFERRRKEEQE